MSSVCPAGILSRSRVIKSLPVTLAALRRSPAKVPPTNPPTSFSSSCWDFGRARYCSSVSVPRTGVFSFSANSDHMISDFGQCVAFLVPAVLICSFLLYCIPFPPSPSCNSYFQILHLLRSAPVPRVSALPSGRRSRPQSFPSAHR